MTRPLPFRIVRPRPEGWWMRLSMGVMTLGWAINTFNVGEADLIAPDVYEVAFRLLDLNKWVMLAGTLALLQILSCTAVRFWTDLLAASALASFWSLFAWSVYQVDPNVLSIAFYLGIACIEAIAVFLSITHASAYVR